MSSQGRVSFQVGQEVTENIRDVDIGYISDFPDGSLKFPEDGVVWLYNLEIDENSSQKSRCTLPLVISLENEGWHGRYVFMW